MPLVLLGGINASVCRSYRHLHYEVTRTRLSSIRCPAILYRSAHPGGDCSTVIQLKADRLLDSSFPGKDLRGGPWTLKCDGEEIRVVSSGPDRRVGTQDDIVVPAEGSH